MRSESGSSVCEASDKEYEKQLQRVLDEYTPQSSQNKHNRQEVSAVKEFLTSKRTSECMNSSETKFAKTRNNQRLSGFKKKPLEGGTGKPTIRKGTGGVGKNGRAGDGPRGLGMSSAKVMEINLELDKVKAMNKSFDGALMSSTIANIDIEELVFAFAGLVVSRIVVAEEPKIREEIACGDREGKSECIED